jgi:hypothetical protein
VGLSLRNFAVRCYLMGAIGRDEARLPTYGDLHHGFGGGYQNRGRFLETIHQHCVAHDEPDLTVLVVSSSTRLPSRFQQKGFESTPEAIARWHAAVRDVRAHAWSNARFLHQAGES